MQRVVGDIRRGSVRSKRILGLRGCAESLP